MRSPDERAPQRLRIVAPAIDEDGARQPVERPPLLVDQPDQVGIGGCLVFGVHWRTTINLEACASQVANGARSRDDTPSTTTTTHGGGVKARKPPARATGSSPSAARCPGNSWCCHGCSNEIAEVQQADAGFHLTAL